MALNCQTFDRGVQINCALFQYQNQAWGYLLKPSFLLPNQNEMLLNITKKKLSVTIISGYRLPKPNSEEKGEIIDPYVIVELITPMYTPSTSSHGNSFRTLLRKLKKKKTTWQDRCGFR